MSLPLDISACGAVTAVGLDSAQTCAAVRAKIAGFSDAFPRLPPHEPVRGAKVAASPQARRNEPEWLANLASRAISECLVPGIQTSRVGIIINIPEEFRAHPALGDGMHGSLTTRLHEDWHRRRGHPLHFVREGHAGMLSGLRQAAGSIAKGKVDACILCGVDSLVNRSDIQRLAGAERLYDRGNPNGVIPGEAAAAVLVTVPGQADRPLARIHGLGLSAEPHSVLGSKYSQGRGLEAALAAALEEAGMPESIVGFRVSDMNGDRYRVWEALFAQARFYRTWRAHLPSWYFTASVGDVGAATGALALVLAATGIFRRYAPAQWGMCECSSEEGLRGACLVGPAEV